MKVSLNGEIRELAEATTVKDLIAALELENAPCAVELNRAVVPRTEHGTTPLDEGDVLEIVTLVGGG
jgi:sulfur carrier protein